MKGQKRLVFFGNAKFQMDFDLVVGLRLQGHDGGLLSLPVLRQGGAEQQLVAFGQEPVLSALPLQQGKISAFQAEG